LSARSFRLPNSAFSKQLSEQPFGLEPTDSLAGAAFHQASENRDAAASPGSIKRLAHLRRAQDLQHRQRLVQCPFEISRRRRPRFVDQRSSRGGNRETLVDA
jgi:hypothetical protein